MNCQQAIAELSRLIDVDIESALSLENIELAKTLWKYRKIIGEINQSDPVPSAPDEQMSIPLEFEAGAIVDVDGEHRVYVRRSNEILTKESIDIEALSLQLFERVPENHTPADVVNLVMEAYPSVAKYVVGKSLVLGEMAIAKMCQDRFTKFKLVLSQVNTNGHSPTFDALAIQ